MVSTFDTSQSHVFIFFSDFWFPQKQPYEKAAYKNTLCNQKCSVLNPQIPFFSKIPQSHWLPTQTEIKHWKFPQPKITSTFQSSINSEIPSEVMKTQKRSTYWWDYCTILKKRCYIKHTGMCGKDYIYINMNSFSCLLDVIFYVFLSILEDFLLKMGCFELKLLGFRIYFQFFTAENEQHVVKSHLLHY